MNIPHKYLINNSLSNEKIQYYQKIKTKYTIAYTKFQKNKKLLKNYRKNVLNWLFSFDLETRMIICSVENKKYTNIMNQLYISHKENHKTKFLIKDDKDEDENISFFYSKSENEENTENILEGFLNEIKFYQCESSIKNLEYYSDYFTLSEKILNDEDLFIYYFNKISHEKYFLKPINTIRDDSSKISNFQLPDWIINNNNSQNNEITYFSIIEYFCGLFEQVISVRFITNYNMKNLNEIYSTSYLKQIFEKSKTMINYLNKIKEKNIFYYFKIDKLIEEMYSNNKLNDFMKKYTNNDNNDNISDWFANPLYFDKSHDLNEVKEEVNHFFGFDKISCEELVKMISLIHIRKLLTYDDFLCRGIFERIYNDYTEKITEDLITDNNFVDNKKKNKKKKKKQKKKDLEKNYNENNKVLNLNNDISDFVKIILFNICNNVIEICDSIGKNFYTNNNCDKQNNNEINYLNEKKKKKIKENKFFLYETVKKDVKYNQKKLNIQNYENSLIDIEKKYNHEEEFQYIQNITTSFSEISNEKNNNNKNILSPISQINSMTISSNNSSTSVDSVKQSQQYYNKKFNDELTNNVFSNGILDNQFLLYENSLISHFDNLNDDIINYISEQEIILNKLYDIKILIYEYLSEITNKIYPNSKLEIYGSTLYKLDIESSDLDLSILSKENLSLSLLVNELNKNYNTIFESIFPILSASIPVIKLILNPIILKNEKLNYIYNQIHLSEFYKNYIFDKKEIDKIRIDITINSINYNQVNFIQNSLLKYPSIFPIIKILKRCLNEKKMNQTYKGGMSSYILFLLVYSFTKWNIFINNKIDSPGELLMHFLYYYIKINFSQTLINPNLNNPFISCNNLEYIPTILDPITKINSAKSVFKIFDVVKVFSFIYKDISMIYNKICDEDLKEEEKGNIIKILFQNFHNK